MIRPPQSLICALKGEANMIAHQAILSWARETLGAAGHKLGRAEPETLAHTPWSYVARLRMHNECFYVKATPWAIREPIIIHTLKTQYHAPVANVIAENKALHCFLMKEAGCSLRAALKQTFNIEWILKAIDAWTILQNNVAHHHAALTAVGVPHWSLNTFAERYKKIILEKNVLMDAGLSSIDIAALTRCIPIIHALSQALMSYGIPNTISQPDCNDNNTLIDLNSQRITLIDLGEIVITHPFFSWLNFLACVKKHHHLKETDEAYITIKNAWLSPYQIHRQENFFVDAMALAKKLSSVYGLLSQHRLLQACTAGSVLSFQPGKVAASFAAVIASLS